MSREDQVRELALDLAHIGALKFGEFTLKSGVTSPMYFDLRLLISYPKVLKKVAKLYGQLLESLQYDRLAGVAYAALPIAGAISLELERPWIFMRKEGIKKDHGLKKSLEGEYKAGETVVIVEDIVNSATSIIEVVGAMKEQDLIVKDAVVLLDYERGGKKNMSDAGYNLHAFATVRELVDIMRAENKIDEAKYQQSLKFMAS
jgi:uridine monophosphate synthetase